MTGRWRRLSGARSAEEATAFAIRAFQIASAFLTGVLLARGLGAEALARFTHLQAWLLLAIGLGAAGLVPLVVRTAAAARVRGDWPTIIAVMDWSHRRVALMGGLVAGGLGLTALLADTDHATRAMLLLALPIAYCGTATLLFDAGTRGLGHVLRGQVGDLIVRPGVILAGLAALYLLYGEGGFGPAFAMAVLMVATVASWIASAALFRRSAAPGAGADAAGPAPTWGRDYLRLGAIGWASAFSLQVGYLVLAWLSPLDEVAYFRIGMQMISVAAIGTTLAGMQYAPAFARAHALGDVGELQRTARRCARLSLAVAAPLCLAFLVAGERIVLLLFGPDYAGAAAPLAVLSLGIVLRSAAGSAGDLLIATGRERDAIAVLVPGQVVHVVLLVLLTPPLGALGAAIAFSSVTAVTHIALVLRARTGTGVVSLPFGGRWG